MLRAFATKVTPPNAFIEIGINFAIINLADRKVTPIVQSYEIKDLIPPIGDKMMFALVLIKNSNL